MICEKERQQLMDVAYGEGELDSELEEHLRSCPECAAYWAELHQVKDLLGEWTPPEESGFRQVKGVLSQVYQRQERQRLVLDLVKFGGVVLTIFSLFYLLYRWQGEEVVLTSYLFLYMFLPLLFIPIYKYEIKKEEGEWK